MQKKLWNDYAIDNIPSDSKFSYPELKNAMEVLLNHNSGYPWVNEFEKKFANRMGVSYAIVALLGCTLHYMQ